MKPIKKTVKRAIDYILDPVKMGDETLVFTHDVNKELAALEFSMTRDEYLKCKPNKHHSGNENLAYHIVQSHSKKDRVTPEMALEVAKKTIKDYTQDYAYVIAVHTDQDHLHTHIIMNAYSHTGKKKLNTHNSVEKLLAISNKHCLEYGLSTSEIKKKKTNKITHKQQYHDDKRKLSGRKKLKHLIDEMIGISKDFDEFIDNIEKAGIQVKERGGLSFLLPDAKRSIRISSLKDDNYDTVEALQKRIEDKQMAKIEPVTKSTNLEIKEASTTFEMPKVKTPRKQTWINYYSRDYWRRKSDNLENISRIAKMLSHMRENDIQEINDYTVLLKASQKDIKSIKNRTTKLERQYDKLEELYMDASTEEQTKLAEQMKEIRAEIRQLNQSYSVATTKKDELEKFKAMFETEKSAGRNKKHERGLFV